MAPTGSLALCLALCTSGVATSGLAAGGDEPQHAPPQGKPHLDLRVALDGERVLHGVAHWRYVNPSNTPLACVHFNLWANFDAEENPSLSAIGNAGGAFNAWEPSLTEILEVTGADGTPLEWRYLSAKPISQTYSLAKVHLVVELRAPLQPGQAESVVIRFRTEIPHRRGDQGYFNGDTTWRFGWFPQPRAFGKGQWSDALRLTSFTHQTRFEVPDEDDLAVIGADRWQQTGRLAVASSDVPVRSIPFVVSGRLHAHEATVAGIAVTVYTYGDGALFDTSEAEAEEKVKQLERILPFLQEHYGAYRFSTLQVLESPTTFVSMAADGLVLLGDLFFIYDRTWLAWGFYRPVGEVTLAHEMAHQWWGIGLGVDFDAENWLSESFAQFLAFDYSRSRFGERGKDMFHTNWFLTWLTANLLGARLPENQFYNQLLPSYRDHQRFGVDDRIEAPARELKHREEAAYLVYEKGYLAARALNAALGVAGARKTLRQIYQEKAGEQVRSEDLRQTALATTGVDLEPFLSQFVRGTAASDYAIVAVDSGRAGLAGPVQTKVKVRRRGDVALPATVEVTTRGQTVTTRWDAEQEEAELTLPTSGPPAQVRLDPEAFVPDVDRRNNVWPQSPLWRLGAPHADPEAHVLAFNPFPMHRRYVAGLSVGGREGNDWTWWFGGGVTARGIEQKPAADGRQREEMIAAGTAYAEVSHRISRAGSLGLALEGTYLPLAASESLTARTWTSGELTCLYSHAFFEPTDVGLTGIFSLPRTTLEAAAGLRAATTHGLTTAEDNYLLERGYTPRLLLRLTRDETLKLGGAASVFLAVGKSSFRRQPFLGGGLDLVYQRPVPYLGRLHVGIGAAGVSKTGSFDERPALGWLPFTALHVALRPYEMAVQGGVRLSVPLLRDLRLKNVVTLGLLVLNDLSLQLHYGLARGWLWRTQRRLAALPDRGELGAALVIGMAPFLGANASVTIGAAAPTWPGKTNFRETNYFYGLVALQLL